MKKYQKIAKIVAIGMTAIVGGALLSGCTTNTKKQLEQTQQDLALAQSTVDSLNSQLSEVNAKLNSAEGSSASLEAQKVELQAQLAQYKLELDEKDKLLLEDAKTAVTEADLEVSYLLDDLDLGQEFNASLSDTKLSYLFDGNVEFDDEDYTAYETIDVVEAKLQMNVEGSNSAPTLGFKEDSLVYSVNLDEDLNTSLIDEENTLKFKFLGEEVEVSSWDDDELTLLKGKEQFVRESEVVDVNGKQVEVFVIGEDFVYVKVDGQGKKVYEGETEVVNGLEVSVKEVVETTSWRAGGATVRLGSKVSESVADGDEYEKDSAWEWTISSNSLGLKLVEEHLFLDEDDDFKALLAGEKLSLPNGFASVLFEGMENPKYDDVKVSLVTKGGNDYLKLKGSFESNFNEYETLYFDATGFYDTDLVLVSPTSVELEGKDLELKLDSGYLKLDNVALKFDFTVLTVDGISVANEEDDWLTAYGVVIKTPEDSVESESLTLQVPDEKVSLSVKVGK